MFRTGVLGSQGGTLYLLNTWLPFGVVPPRRGVITVTVTFFVLSHRRKKMESLFFPPSSSFFLPSPPRLPRVHGINCVHFNYDLISEERWGTPRGGWSTGMPLCVCGFGWIVSRGHDLRTSCYWVSVVPPRPWPSLSSNSPPPPEDPQVHMHTNTHTPISSPRTPCFINAPRTSHCASLPLPIFPVFSSVSSLCFSSLFPVQHVHPWPAGRVLVR